MYTALSTADKEKYERALYSSNRAFGIKVTILYADPSISYENYSNSLITTNFSFESSAGETGTFSLGSANIDTLTLNCEYTGDNRATGISGAKEDATLFKVECGYGPEARHWDNTLQEYVEDIVYIPIGYFTLQSKSSQISANKYELKLQSLMTKFDKLLPPVFDIASEMTAEIAQYNTGGCTPLIILLWICKHIYKRNTPRDDWDIPMELSSVMDPDTPSGIQYLYNLANIDQVFNITEETGYLTYRDIIKDVAAVCGCFATMDRVGNLLLVPFTTAGPHWSLNNPSSVQGTIDIVSKYGEDIAEFRIDEIQCKAELTDEQGNKSAVDFDYPIDEVEYRNYYDITGLKILSSLEDVYDMQQITQNLWNKISYSDIDPQTGEVIINYAPVPFNITTCAPDFRFDLGDWVHAQSQFNDLSGNPLRCSAQLMSISWKCPGNCTYKSFNTPSDNDRNASKRQSEAQGDYPTGGGGTPPTPPEPPVVIVDDTGQWKFNDDDELIEEYEQIGQPGQTYIIPQIGQWAFEIPIL